jgi:hypothetical protein
MSTSIESLLKTSGKFLKEDELNQIKKDLSELLEENKKLAKMVNDFQNKPVAVQQPVPVMYQSPGPTPPPMPPMYPSMQPAQQKQHTITESLPSTVSFPAHPSHQAFQPQKTEYMKESVIPAHSTPISHFSAQSAPVSLPSDQKTITIIIDTNKMVYLLLFIILALIILKK